MGRVCALPLLPPGGVSPLPVARSPGLREFLRTQVFNSHTQSWGHYVFQVVSVILSFHPYNLDSFSNT